ncbi:hypothetical protein Bbelb_052110 [Branchiostoma belcheri]|nr:hypothetical protein Bbelb_052110 [Branchiostoma belcheri]
MEKQRKINLRDGPHKNNPFTLDVRACFKQLLSFDVSAQQVLTAVFDKALKCILVRAGLNPHLYSLHSGRRGGATFAFRAGVPVELIRLQGDWRSDAYLLYLKDAPGCAQNRHAEEKRLEREAVERLCQTGKTKGYKHISPKVASALSQYNQFCTNMQRRYNVYRALDTTLLLRAHSTCTRMRSRERPVTPTGDQNWGFENLQNRPTMPIEVQVGYLLVGHTHKDVDQFFSKISSTIQRQDATTVEELNHAFNNSFPNVKTWELEAILDVKAFLGDDFASDEEWKLPINNEVRLVEQLPPPNTKPELVKPRIERLDIEQFEHGVEALWQSGKKADWIPGSPGEKHRQHALARTTDAGMDRGQADTTSSAHTGKDLPTLVGDFQLALYRAQVKDKECRFYDPHDMHVQDVLKRRLTHKKSELAANVKQTVFTLPLCGENLPDMSGFQPVDQEAAAFVVKRGDLVSKFIGQTTEWLEDHVGGIMPYRFEPYLDDELKSDPSESSDSEEEGAVSGAAVPKHQANSSKLNQPPLSQRHSPRSLGFQEAGQLIVQDVFDNRFVTNALDKMIIDEETYSTNCRTQHGVVQGWQKARGGSGPKERPAA